MNDGYYSGCSYISKWRFFKDSYYCSIDAFGYQKRMSFSLHRVYQVQNPSIQYYFVWKDTKWKFHGIESLIALILRSNVEIVPSSFLSAFKQLDMRSNYVYYGGLKQGTIVSVHKSNVTLIYLNGQLLNFLMNVCSQNTIKCFTVSKNGDCFIFVVVN